MRPVRAIMLAAVPALLAGLLASPASAGSSIIYVDDDGNAGPGGCEGGGSAVETVQGGVDAAGPGDTVVVCPGEYTERVTIDGDRDGMTLRASSRWSARLIGPVEPLAGVDGGTVLTVDGVRDVTVQWLVVATRVGGDCLHYTDLVRVTDARGVRVRGNHLRPIGSQTLSPCGYSDGIHAEDSRGILISSNLIRDFTSDGIELDSTTRATVRGNSVRYLHASSGSEDGGGSTGIDVGARDAIVKQNVVRSRGVFGAVPNLLIGIAVGGPGALVRDNWVRGAEEGIHVEASDGRYVRNDIADGAYGIDVGGEGNVFRSNVAEGNQELDCDDHTGGATGTHGTDNTWIDNVGENASPDGICSLVP